MAKKKINEDINYEFLQKQIDELRDNIKEAEKTKDIYKENLLNNIASFKIDIIKTLDKNEEKILDKVYGIERDIKKDFSEFKTDKFAPMVEKTNKLGWKVGIIVTIFVAVIMLVINNVVTDSINMFKKQKNIQLMEEYKNHEINKKDIKQK